jgi:hypothetical protein
MTTPGPWKVITWKHANCGGTSLVFLYEPGRPFAIATGPTPWGSGSWGPFPPDAIRDVRDLRPDDSWPVNGCPSSRWTPANLVDALARNEDPRAVTLRAEIARIAAIGEPPP